MHIRRVATLIDIVQSQSQSHCDRKRFRGEYKAHGLGSQLIDVIKLHLIYRDHLVITL